MAPPKQGPHPQACKGAACAIHPRRPLPGLAQPAHKPATVQQDSPRRRKDNSPGHTAHRTAKQHHPEAPSNPCQHAHPSHRGGHRGDRPQGNHQQRGRAPTQQAQLCEPTHHPVIAKVPPLPHPPPGAQPDRHTGMWCAQTRGGTLGTAQAGATPRRTHWYTRARPAPPTPEDPHQDWPSPPAPKSTPPGPGTPKGETPGEAPGGAPSPNPAHKPATQTATSRSTKQPRPNPDTDASTPHTGETGRPGPAHTEDSPQGDQETRHRPSHTHREEAAPLPAEPTLPGETPRREPPAAPPTPPETHRATMPDHTILMYLHSTR
ncbi:extensin-like [Gouania willdenowi]|uniref:extensin-like n=1 Tax=Gouania willdenowi TaxID=441366 RepID=UPI001055C875|nr:extensin-like [Gouania willdenowi]